MQQSKFNKIHPYLNIGLASIQFVLALYLIASPFIPNLTLWWQQRSGEIAGAQYGGSLVSVDSDTSKTAPFTPPATNRLVIPSMNLDEEISEGSTIRAAREHPWRRPLSSTPEYGGNTVIVGHRWTYGTVRDVFYHMDKMQVGDRFAVYWKQVEYTYEVSEIKIVPPSEVSIEAQTDEPTLTLYTCTPLWTSKSRLVVISHVIGTRTQ